jgi:hypothetical protein
MGNHYHLIRHFLESRKVLFFLKTYTLDKSKAMLTSRIRVPTMTLVR